MPECSHEWEDVVDVHPPKMAGLIEGGRTVNLEGHCEACNTDVYIMAEVQEVSA